MVVLCTIEYLFQTPSVSALPTGFLKAFLIIRMTLRNYSHSLLRYFEVDASAPTTKQPFPFVSEGHSHSRPNRSKLCMNIDNTCVKIATIHTSVYTLSFFHCSIIRSYEISYRFQARNPYLELAEASNHVHLAQYNLCGLNALYRPQL